LNERLNRIAFNNICSDLIDSNSMMA